jgi:uncharacterized membrane protein
MFYPHELQDKDIELHIHRFTSPLNRVLVDYKQFQSVICGEIDRVAGMSKNEAKAGFDLTALMGQK